MHLIDGEKIALGIKQDLKQRIQFLKQKPTLAIVYAGYNEASEIYVNKKANWAKEIGIYTEIIRLPDTDNEELINTIENLNQNDEVSGIIVQLPLPKGVDTKRVLRSISLEKDVDGLNPLSLGLLWHGNKDIFISATALSVMECLRYVAQYSEMENYLTGKNVLIINHSILVGRPLAALLLNHNATVTIAHKFTPAEKLKELILQNEIIISATGQSGLITSDMVRDRQVLIDVGIDKSSLGVGGDILRKGMETKDIFLSPVPNGVGPVTVAMLLNNTCKAHAKKLGITAQSA